MVESVVNNLCSEMNLDSFKYASLINIPYSSEFLQLMNNKEHVYYITPTNLSSSILSLENSFLFFGHVVFFEDTDFLFPSLPIRMHNANILAIDLEVNEDLKVEEIQLPEDLISDRMSGVIFCTSELPRQLVSLFYAKVIHFHV